MPTIDVQSFSEQQKQKDLMKESNKALEATKEVKPEQEEPKQVQEPVVKEEVVKEEPVKELPSMDKKEEAKQDIVVDVEDAMNTTPMEDFTQDDDSGMSLLERMYGVDEDRFLVADMAAVKRWERAHRSWIGNIWYDITHLNDAAQFTVMWVIGLCCVIFIVVFLFLDWCSCEKERKEYERTHKNSKTHKTPL